MQILPDIIGRVQSANPKVAAHAAHFLFTHPLPPSIRSKAEKRLAKRAWTKLAEANREDLRVGGYRIATYHFDTTASTRIGTAMLVHGWTSTAAYMTAPVEDLRARGFDVIAFDMPAHGKSSGHQAKLMDCVLAMVAVAEQNGPIDRIIAHSFGGPVTALALTSELSPALSDDTDLIFIASPNRLSDVTEQFSRALGLSNEAQRLFEDMVVAPFGGDMAAMDGNLLLETRPNKLTILHSRDDHEVSFAAAERFAGLGAKVNLQPLDGLGHRRILHAQPSLDALIGAVEN